jgi:diaminohydroxyphosphoribosylaminopyrimidine deaminase/5-amino-6-(5-phosphoribosylamino)uracil reductase
MVDDSFFMNLAIDKAWRYQILTYPNPAVGAVVVENGRILSIEAHKKAGSSHAEIRALLGAWEVKSKKSLDFDKDDAKKAHKFLSLLPKKFFIDCEIYVTLEPCSHDGKTPSCANLLSKLKPKRVIIATADPIDSHSGGIKILKETKIKVDFGIEKSRAEKLLEPFKIWQKRTFVLFKLAQSLNGKIGGGYLSSAESLAHTHQIREVIDRLIIGGETVRVDRPKLDCRFSNPQKAPDITIYSNKKLEEFDQSIPLFQVKGREVKVCKSLDLSKGGLVLVEGGDKMLKALSQRVDWLLVYLTPKLSSNEISYNLSKNIEFLHQERIGVDLKLWSKFE